MAAERSRVVKATTPLPYPSTRRFLAYISDLRDGYVQPPAPSVHDQGAGRVLAALRHLGLIAPDGSAALTLVRLSRLGPEERLDALGAVIRDGYGWVWEPEPATTHEEFLRRLDGFGMVPGTAAKAASFFVGTSRAIGLELPFATRLRGRPRKVAAADRASKLTGWDPGGTRQRYADLLLETVTNQAANGNPDPALLDRIEKLLGI